MTQASNGCIQSLQIAWWARVALLIWSHTDLNRLPKQIGTERLDALGCIGLGPGIVRRACHSFPLSPPNVHSSLAADLDLPFEQTLQKPCIEGIFSNNIP